MTVQSRSARHDMARRCSLKQIVWVVMATAALGGCQSQPTAAEMPHQTLRVSTAYAPFSTRLTEEYRRTMPDLEIAEVPLCAFRAGAEPDPIGCPRLRRRAGRRCVSVVFR
ncbi:MAG: hypothetical protein QM736_17760 [Vicinamibacterales bacterium]